MNHPLLACRLGTSTRAPCWALSPKPYTMCAPTRMRIRTRTLTLARTSHLRLSPLDTLFNSLELSPPLTSMHLHLSSTPGHTHIYIHL